MTQQSRRSPLDLDRALDERPGAGFSPLLARHAARCRLHGVRDSDPLASASAPAPRSLAWSTRCCCVRSRFATPGQLVFISNGDDFTATQTEPTMSIYGS